MINALARKKSDLIVARWVPKGADEKEGGKLIKVKIPSEWRRGIEQPIPNLRVESENTVLETKYNYDFKTDDRIKFDGAWWLITGIGREYKHEREKSLALARIAYAEKYTRLSVMKIGGADERF